MEELAVLKKTGVELLINWINEAEGRIDGLGFLLLFVIDALPDEQFKAVDESIANNLRALKSDTPPCRRPTKHLRRYALPSFGLLSKPNPSCNRRERKAGPPIVVRHGPRGSLSSETPS